MKNKKFEKELYTMLSNETPDLLSKIKDHARFRVVKQEQTSSIWYKFKQTRYSYALSSIFVLGLFVFAILLAQSPSQNEVIASTITIDINPSVELSLNENDEVIAINPINGDAQTLLENKEQFHGMTIDNAIRALVQKAIDQGFVIDGENSLLINVDANNAEKRALLQEKLKAAFTRESLRHNTTFTVRNMMLEPSKQDIDEAHNLHMSVAKYELILTILEASNNYTFEDLENASIRDLFDLINELDIEDTNFPPMGPPNDVPGHGNGR